MMEHLGIDPGAGTISRLGLSYAAAFHRCACREWLDRMRASVALAPRFCPNADIFFALRVDEPGAWSRNLHS
jgi:hypothetical protein